MSKFHCQPSLYPYSSQTSHEFTVRPPLLGPAHTHKANEDTPDQETGGPPLIGKGDCAVVLISRTFLLPKEQVLSESKIKAFYKIKTLDSSWQQDSSDSPSLPH